VNVYIFEDMTESSHENQNIDLNLENLYTKGHNDVKIR